MVAFAVGGLLGDTFFHLMPEIFLGEGEAMVRVEPKRNLLLGFGIVVGFITFVGVDKAVRILNGGEGHEHGHGHAHGREIVKEEGSPKGKRKRAAGGAAGKVKKEKSEKSAVALKVRAEKTESSNPSVKLGGLLNMMYVPTPLLTFPSPFSTPY
jgi:ZIP Zinc transporter.